MTKKSGGELGGIPADQTGLYKFLASGRIPLISLVEALVVAEHLSFRKAATTLGISQSAISDRIATLEDELGVRLFERGRGVRLTMDGWMFLDLVAGAVTCIGQALGTVGVVAARQRNTLRVGVQC